MKSLYAMIPATVLAALVLGCGGKTEQAATPAADSAATPGAAPAAAQAAAAPAEVPRGQYAVCQACHQENGQGLPPAFPPLAGSEVVNGPAEIPIAIVLHGLQGPLKVNGTDYNGMMAAWGTLSDEDIAATLTYERASWGNSAPAVTAAQVAAVRAATKGRITAWTWQELQKAKLQ